MKQTILIVKQAMPRSLSRALIVLIAAALLGAAAWVTVALVLPQFTPTYKTQFLIDTAGEPGDIRGLLQKVVQNAGDRDALALRSFGGECGTDDNTTQLVDFGTSNRAKITEAAQSLRETGKATLVRGIVEAVADFSTPFSLNAKQVNRIIVITRHGIDACDDDTAFVENEIRDRIAAAGLAVEFRLVGYQVPADQRDRLVRIATKAGAPAPAFTQTPAELEQTLGWFTNTEPVLRDAQAVVTTLNATIDQVNTAVRAIIDGRLDVARQNLDQARDAVTDGQFEDLQTRRKSPETQDVNDKAMALRARQVRVLDAAGRLLDTVRSGVSLERPLAEFKQVADDYNTEVHTMNQILAALRALGPGGQA